MNYSSLLRRAGLALTAFGLVASSAWAGRSCDAARPPQPATLEKGLTLAERTLKALDASGAKVVVLARAGQDLSMYGLRYSHLGWAYQQPMDDGTHVWRVLHKLNLCGSKESAIYRQGLGEFFLDDLWRFEAAWVVPTPQVQTQMLALLQDESKALSLHHKPYNLVSYVWGTTYQQSNQWAIETLALALAPATVSRAQAQQWLQRSGYQATTLKIGPMTRLAGRITSANVAFDDHPSAKRFSDRIETVTVDSVFDWLQQAGMAAPPVKLAL